MKRVRTARLTTAILGAATALCLIPGEAAAGPHARIHVQAPVKLSNPAKTNLSRIEHYGKTPVFSRSFNIPYDQLEGLIRGELNKLPKSFSGKETCKDPCPDVTWSVKLKPSFRFTQKGQPTLKSIGNSSANTVEVKLHTEARFDVHADVVAETWSDKVELPIDAHVVIGLDAKASAKLWPDLKLVDLDLDLRVVSSNLNLQLNGTVIKLGVKYGSILGTTPLGIMGGGPLALGSLMAVFGNAAADMAEKEIQKLFSKEVGKQLDKVTKGLDTKVKNFLNPKIAKVNQLKNKTMNSKLPGVGKSLQQLSAQMGASLKLHTVASSSKVASSAVMRFTGAAGNSEIKGTLKIPGRQCIYAEIMGTRMPVGFQEMNTQLKPKIGKSCGSVFGSSAVSRNVYLGGNPRDVLGSKAQSLPNWKSGGSLKFTGTLKHEENAYECRFEVEKLPNAAIVELKTGSGVAKYLAGKNYKKRAMAVNFGSYTQVLNAGMKPTSNLVVGTSTSCDGGSGGGPRLRPNKVQALKDLLDPDKCPQCFVKRIRGNEVIYEVKDPAAVGRTAIGREVMAKIKKHNAKRSRTTRRRTSRMRSTRNAAPSSKSSSKSKSKSKSSSKSKNASTSKATPSSRRGLRGKSRAGGLRR